MENLIKKLKKDKNQSITSFIGVSYVMVNNEAIINMDKVRWYIMTAYSLLEDDFELSREELEEFSNIHLKYIKKINKERIKIPLDGLLNRFELINNLNLN